MNFALLWIDGLIVALLWMAMFTACIGRIHRKWARIVLLGIVFLFPGWALGSFAAAGASMKFRAKIEPNWFVYFFCLLIAYVAGSVIILWRAGKRKAGLAPASASWRRIPLALALVIVVGVGYMALLNMDVAFRARCAILGVKVSMQYWAAAPAIMSESQNAAPMYKEVLRRMPVKAIENIYNPPFGDKKVFDPNDAATIYFLNKYADALALLRRAAALPACRFDEDLEAPSFAQFLPELNQVRYTAMALDLDAREQLSRGNVALAVDDASAVFGMSRHFGQRPLEISALVGMGINAEGNNMLERILPAVKSKDDLAGLHLDNLMPLGHMLQQSLRGEEQYGLMMYGNMPGGEPPGTVAIGKPRPPAMSPEANSGAIFFRVFFLDLDDYISLMQGAQMDAIEPYYKIRDQLHVIENHRWGMFTRILEPVLSRVFLTSGVTEAKNACAKTAVAMTWYRLDHGALPSRLEDLIPKYLDAIPGDPFDGQPLRLAIKKTDWIIYSVGPNGIDDGGVADLDREKKGDVIFTLKSLNSPTTQSSR